MEQDAREARNEDNESKRKTLESNIDTANERRKNLQTDWKILLLITDLDRKQDTAVITVYLGEPI